MRVPLSTREYARVEGLIGPMSRREYARIEGRALVGALPARVIRFIARLMFSLRRLRPAFGGRGREDPPGSGSGDRSPLVPRLPLLSGSAAKRLE